jgi:hypothetical protein
MMVEHRTLFLEEAKDGSRAYRFMCSTLQEMSMATRIFNKQAL